MSHTEEEWARNLVGREWEIFWDSGNDEIPDEKALLKEEIISSEYSGKSTVVESIESQQAIETNGITIVANSEKIKGEKIEHEDEPEPSDWYDGIIVSAEKCYDGKFLFAVKFVGDEQDYHMVLERELVRPSARAWIQRTRALMLPRGGFDAMKHKLPPDTMTMNDVPEILQLKESLDKDYSFSCIESDANIGNSGSFPIPSVKDLTKVNFLLFQVRAQRYLRTKLATITDHGERGDEDPTEAYVNHLVSCLEQLDQVCTWYDKCYLFHQQVVGTGTTKLLPVLDFETVQNSIENGIDQLISLSAIDMSHGGAKRKPANIPSGTRKTKRRRIHKEPGFMSTTQVIRHVNCNENENDHFILRKEGQYMNNKCVQEFTKRILQSDHRWFQIFFCEMLRNISLHLHDPMLKWKNEAEAVLGDRTPFVGDQSETETSIEMSSKREEIDSLSTISGDDEDIIQYSFEDIESCYQAFLNQEVLRKCNFSRLIQRLENKLAAIQAFETQAWKLLSALVQEPEAGSLKTSDNILVCLKKLKDAAENSDQNILNVDPLGSSRSSKMNRDVLRDAIAVREWVLDLRHCENFRERVSFVQDVVSRAPSLPHVPSSPNSSDSEDSVTARLAKVMTDVQNVSSNIYAHLHVFTRFERLVTESSDLDADPEHFRSVEGVTLAFEQLRSIPVLSTVEEKLAVRLDIMKWRILAESQLSAAQCDFSVIEELHKELSNILAGENRTRVGLVTKLECSHAVDKEIRAFAVSDAKLLAHSTVIQVQKLYTSSYEWKKRADVIILSLQIHGNPLAGLQMTSTKVVAMVDLKRVDDLLVEYPLLNVTLMKQHQILLRVKMEAKEWSLKIAEIVTMNHDLYASLVKEREQRPKGLIMEPARHVVDFWVDALDWLNRVTASLHLVSVGSMYTSDLYPLILEGMDVVVSFSSTRKLSNDNEFTVEPEIVSLLVAGLTDSHRQLRHFSKEKLESTELGKIVFTRLVNDDKNDQYLHCLVFILWRLTLLDLLDKCDGTIAEAGSHRPTLIHAKRVLHSQPQDNKKQSDAEETLFLRVFAKGSTSELERFRMLIIDGEETEATARMLLHTTKDLIRGSFNHADSLRKHFSRLKEVQSDFKARSQVGPGFVLNVELEQQLDHCIKDLSWLVKTLPFPVLHFDDADLVNLTKATTLQWDVLVTLLERIPTSADDGNHTDIARVALRVRELHDAANLWQEEVSTLLSLSFRGAKRRSPSSTQSKMTFALESENQEKIDLSKMAELAKNPILKVVLMPRESAVKEVLENAHTFEIELHNMLGEDFTLSATDKSPYPDSDSLVGDNGDFHMYRLTGSPLFEELLHATKRVEKVANAVCADTPGKSAFDWIKRAVQWVQSLEEAVIDESPLSCVNGLSIPVESARHLITVGNDLFLDGVSEDIRKTLSVHKILLSTNKQTNKLTVSIGKGGAHHSIGGVCIKWCPLLHEWLKEDFIRLTEWETRVTLHSQNFELPQTDTIVDEEVLYRVYLLLEDTERLLEEGRSALVVTPQRSLVDRMLAWKNSIDEWILQNCKVASVVENLQRRRYEDGGVAVNRREDVLLDLLNRRRLQASGRGSITGQSEDTTYRDKARSILEKALNKGVKMMGINQLNATDVSLLCTLRAFELENAIFAEMVESQADYRDKVRSLRSSMEDVRYPSLSARYLLSEISAEHLLSISPEELESTHLRQMKATVDATSKRSVAISNRLTKGPNGKGTVKNILKAAMKTLSESVPTLVERCETSPPNDVILLTQNLPANTRSHAPPSPVLTPIEAFPSTVNNWLEVDYMEPLMSPSLATLTPSALTGKLKALNSSSGPPPPPLLGIPVASISPPNIHNRYGNFIISSSGSDIFSFTVNRNSFRGNLLFEDESSSDVRNGLLPESLSEKGRLSIPEFQKFIGQKIDGGRWIVFTLRLSVTSEYEAYKGYYKEYEAKNRIVMFGIGKETKVFLVTPKFHRDAKSLRHHFTVKTSTYAIVMTREQIFE